MITFTRCAFMAKQACATCSKVVQKITPPIANNFLKFFFTLFAILTLNAATAWAEDYSIKFLTNTSDGSNEITSSTRTVTVLESASCSNVSGFTNNCIKAYYKGKSGVKLSSGSASGTLEFTLSDVCNKNVSKVVFKTAKYNSESSTLTFYAGTSNLGTVTAGNEFSYTFTEPQSISTLKISSTKRAYVSEITISVNSAVTPESGTGKTATYTVSSATAVTATGNIPQGSTATLSGTGSLNGGFIQCINGKNHTLTLTGYEGYKITGVTIHVKSNSSKGTGSFSVVAGSKTIANVVESAFNSTNWNGSWNNSGVDKVLTMTDNSYEIKTGENVKLTINCKSGSSDYNSLYIKSYTITYEPVSSTSEPENPTANYTIKHYLQNILDDNYTLKDTKTLSGEVGTEVTPSVESYEGFTAPSTQTVTIASDGSTVVEYKYTRNSYKLTWDLDGGTITTVGTTAGSVKYGATIIAPTVTKDGCQFKNWNPSVPATMPADDATYTAQWSKLYTITLSENGTPTEPTTQTSTTYKLPTALAEGSCQDDTKELVGWSTVAIPNPGDMPTSDFYKKGETVTLSEDKTTFYAVFATVDGGGATDNTNVYTSNVSINAGTAITNTSVVIDQEEYNATKAGTGSAKGSVLVTIPAGTTYLSFYMAGWKDEGGKTITLTGAEAEPSSFKTIADDGVTGNGNYELVGDVARYAYSTTLNNVTQETQITFSNEGADQRFVIWGVNASAGATYSNYSTTCVPAPKLVSITQTAGQTEFTEGDEFVKATITATYDDESTKDVTSKATFSTPDMTQVGEKTISVSYKEGEVTAETSYKINIKEKTKYTINWWANGEKYHTQTAVEGTAIDVPASSDVATYACDDKVFVGWVDAEIIGSTNTEPTFITEFGEIEGDKAFFAVFATEQSSSTTTSVYKLVTNISGGKEYIFATGNSAGSVNGLTCDANSNLTATSLAVKVSSGITYIETPASNNVVWNITSSNSSYNAQNKGQSGKYLRCYGTSPNAVIAASAYALYWDGSKGLYGKSNSGNTSYYLYYNTSNSQWGAKSSPSGRVYAFEKSEITFDNTTYSGYVTTCEASTETLSGKFSTGKYEYAEFATGNLQYKPSTDSWRFAKQQYQVVGDDNINVGDPNYKGWIDMLGWSTNDADNNYGVNPNNVNDLYDGTFQDWGDLFSADENWSTLSADQWKYLLNERTNASSLKQIARVGSVVGIMLFPDNWNAPLTVTAQHDSYFDVDIHNYTLDQWAALENAGALFLPAAGRRTGGYGNKINKDQVVETNPANLNGGHYKHQDNTNIYCYYWTSTINESTKDVSYLHNIQALGGDKYTIGTGAIWGEKGRYGQSVRLAKVTSTLIEIGGGDNSDVITANEDKTVNVKVNRTFMANNGYYTICLPFNIDADEIGKAYQIKAITEHVAGEGINVEFTEVTTLTAGQPYLLLPSENLENPTFEGVTIVKTTGETTEPVVGAGIKITFTGIINGVGEYTNGNTDYYVGDNGLLYNGTTKKLGLRAFFTITDEEGNPTKVRARVVVGENTTTDLENILNGENTTIKVIENGQLIIIRNGEKFNAQGQKL